MRLKYSAEWNLGLEGSALAQGSQPGEQEVAATALQRCNMPIKGFRMHLLKHTQQLTRV